MSKSLKRVRAALDEAGLDAEIVEMGETRTAQQAADAVGCGLDQIVKSIIYRGEESERAILFLTAGGNRVDDTLAAQAAGEPLGKADATLVRAQTGFAIGGVAPLGHTAPVRTFCDPLLTTFDVVWAAAGTPRHVFPIPAGDLLRLTGAELALFTAARGM
ncbi:YbaK/EbsC family protein [Tranquillimonas rosea]|uniref:YbaK/EbsC family protein n=1 Tax=Tranquillimonas rosea TaxID=641238 RepID=UPI003BA9B0CD